MTASRIRTRSGDAAELPASASANVADLVSAAAVHSPTHPALLEPIRGLTLSWSELDAAVDAEADRLAGAGLAEGQRVLIRLANGTAYCIAVLGALRAGAIAVPVGPRTGERELALVVDDCDPTLVVAEPADGVVTGAVTGAVSAVPAARPKVLVPPDPSARAERSVRRGGGEDIAVLGYPSVTTGTSRGVRLSHRALLANRAQTAALRPTSVTPADRVLLHLPLSHLYGLGAGLLQVCWAGATGVLVDEVDPTEVIEAIVRHRVTTVTGVPSMYRALLELPPRRLWDGMVTVRLCTAGGAPLAPELLRAFRAAAGLDLFEGYGLTESAPVLTSTLVGGVAKPGSVGRPLPGVELRLVEPDGADPEVRIRDDWDPDDPDDPEADDDPVDTGLVAVRGSNLFSGYWPDGVDGPDPDGWFRTSDVGFFDSDGDLHLVNRYTDAVIVNGFTVYPHEVEGVLVEHPSVLEAAVVGVPDQRTGEAIKAILALHPGGRLTAEEVRTHCAERLARFKVPAVVEFIDELPHSATGKITRQVLRAETVSS